MMASYVFPVDFQTSLTMATEGAAIFNLYNAAADVDTSDVGFFFLFLYFSSQHTEVGSYSNHLLVNFSNPQVEL